MSTSTAARAASSTVVTPVLRSGLRSDSTAISSSCPFSTIRPTLLTVHRPPCAPTGSQPSLSATSPPAALTPHACSLFTDDMSPRAQRRLADDTGPAGSVSFSSTFTWSDGWLRVIPHDSPDPGSVCHTSRPWRTRVSPYWPPTVM
ncbi:hypothetical protein DMB42_19690 [Nonomuraea sp. WAC 01424]|nr:hypothetical protein DMB42_19690 [Nonomuraea sp. WAC 01424]